MSDLRRFGIEFTGNQTEAAASFSAESRNDLRKKQEQAYFVTSEIRLLSFLEVWRPPQPQQIQPQ